MRIGGFWNRVELIVYRVLWGAVLEQPASRRLVCLQASVTEATPDEKGILPRA